MLYLLRHIYPIFIQCYNVTMLQCYNVAMLQWFSPKFFHIAFFHIACQTLFCPWLFSCLFVCLLWFQCGFSCASLCAFQGCDSVWISSGRHCIESPLHRYGSSRAVASCFPWLRWSCRRCNWPFLLCAVSCVSSYVTQWCMQKDRFHICVVLLLNAASSVGWDCCSF